MPGKMRKVPARKSQFEKGGSKPTFNIDEKQLPDIKDWKTGKEYEIKIKVKQIGSELERHEPNKGLLVNRFEIIEVKSDTNSK